MTAETASGLRYAFHDARAQLGHLLEVYEPSPGVLRLYGKVADAAAGWDGERPGSRVVSAMVLSLVGINKGVHQ